MVNSVPVWVLTTVVEVGLLGVGGLSLMLWLSARSKRGLRANIALLEEALEARTAATVVPEAASLAEEEALTVSHESPPAEAETRAVLAADDDGVDAAITQEKLDEIFAVGDAETQQSLGTLRAESAAMAQKVDALQQRNGQLRQAVEAVQHNSALPEDEQQEMGVPEELMQDMETELLSLQQTCQSLQGSLQEHCTLLESKLGNQAAQESEGNPTGVDVHQIKAELEQRTADFQRIQEEYDALLNEYQRIYET